MFDGIYYSYLANAHVALFKLAILDCAQLALGKTVSVQ